MRTLYQPAALEEFREAIIWYIEAAGQRQAEALDKEINAKLELLKAHLLIGTPGSDADPGSGLGFQHPAAMDCGSGPQ